MDGEHGGEDHLARTARIYDALPYTSRGVFRTHPARLAGVAKLYGLDPVAPARARVLELGCAAGGNLIPLAALYPQARFVGIDLGQVMIDDGQARIDALGLRNIALRTQSITDLADDGEPFDYIICHGVYSWVPAAVRTAILDICGNRLSPNGVAYVSYNVLPGWRLFQPIRDAMRIVADSIGEAARARQGRSLLKFLAETTPQRGAWGELLRRVPGLIGDNEDYFFHEYMEPVNEPCMFMDFVGDAGRHGLAYLGESVLATMFTEAHGREFAAKVDAVTGDIVQQQQMLDILVGTPFRTSLLVRQAQADRIDRAGAAANLGTLFVGQSGLYEYERLAESRAKLSAKGDPDRTIDDPGAIAMLGRLFDPVPRTWSVDALLAGLDISDEAFFAIMSQLIAIGVVVPLSEPLCAAGVSERPLADPLVRADAAQGRTETTNLFHATIELTDEHRLLVPLLDGEHDHAQLANLVAEAVEHGRLVLKRDDGSLVPQGALSAAAPAMVASNLASLARSGLLIA